MEERAMSAMRRLLSACVPGDILEGTVDAIEPTGITVAVGAAKLWLPASRIALSPICGTARFRLGQKIPCAVWRIEREVHKITLTHRELLGTFDELVCEFLPGHSYIGTAATPGRVELAPNLVARAATDAVGAGTGEAVIFRVDEIDRLRGEISGQITARTTPAEAAPFTYYITNGRIKHWSFHAPQQFFCTEETFFAD
ncbi:MAG: hypothetical protein E7452_07940 [Ruminococcaceae bacterium]|nr:hypothetical protein [Oscillospiraceae bacterium]